MKKSEYVMEKSGIVNLINLCCSLEWKDKDLSDKREVREMAKQDYDATQARIEELEKANKRKEKRLDYIKENQSDGVAIRFALEAEDWEIDEL